MSQRSDESTEMDIRPSGARRASQAAIEPLPVAPCHADPSQPCEWLRDQVEIRRLLRSMERTLDDMRDDVADVKADMARGSEKFQNLKNLPDIIANLTKDVATLQTTVGVLRMVVFGVCGAIGLSIIGAIMGLVLTRAAP